MRNITKSQVVTVENKNLCIIKTDIENRLYLAIELNGADNDKIFKIVEINDFENIQSYYIIEEFYKIDNAIEEFNIMSKGR